MEFIIAGMILLTVTNLLYYHKFRTARKQYRKVRAKLRKQIRHASVAHTLDSELQATEQKLHELEDLVFEHVST